MRCVAAAMILAFGAVALAGCEDLQPMGPGAGGAYAPAPFYRPPPPPPPRPLEGFSPSEFAWSEGSGPGALSGRVSYHAAAGQHWTCSGQTIALIPGARYAAERMEVLYGSRSRAVVPAGEVRSRNAAQPGVDYGRFVRTAACDAHDRFSFAGLQPGPYFLIARARPRGQAADPNEGVVIMQRLEISPGVAHLVVPQS